MQERVWIIQIHQSGRVKLICSSMTGAPEGGFLEKIRIRALQIYLIALASASELLLASTLLM